MNYFDLTNQLHEEYITESLKELSAYYSNRLSYTEVEQLIVRLTGDRLLSDQKINQIVLKKAEAISQKIASDVESAQAQAAGQTLVVNSEVDIYNPQEPEILLFDDGIQVKGQKSERHKSGKAHETKLTQDTLKPKTPAVNIDLVMLQKSSGGFEYITAPLQQNGQESPTLARVVRAKFLQEYAQQASPLNLVAITDGAKVIRQRLLAIFNTHIPLFQLAQSIIFTTSLDSWFQQSK